MQEVWRSQEDEKFSATEPRELYGFTDKVRNLSVKFGKPAKPMGFLLTAFDRRPEAADLQIPSNAQHTMDPTRFSFSLTEGARGSPPRSAEKARSAGGDQAHSWFLSVQKLSGLKKNSESPVNRHGSTEFFCGPSCHRVIHQLCQGFATKISKSFGAPQPDTGWMYSMIPQKRQF